VLPRRRKPRDSEVSVRLTWQEIDMTLNGRHLDASMIEGEVTSPGSLPLTQHNIGEAERWASIVGGAVLIVGGLLRGNSRGALAALIGGGLFYRGVSGHCLLYELLGISTAASPARQAVERLQHSVAVEAQAAVEGDSVSQASFDSFPASDPPGH
jgi:hypothetical protein